MCLGLLNRLLLLHLVRDTARPFGCGKLLQIFEFPGATSSFARSLFGPLFNDWDDLCLQSLA